MTDSRLMQRYTAKSAAPEEKPVETESAPDDLGACGVLRGIRDRAIMLELRHKDGQVRAFSYAYLQEAVFNPSDGIELRFGTKTVKIAGRNLHVEIRPNTSVFSAIVRHRAVWIRESDGPTALAASRQAVVVDDISVE